MSTAKQCWVWVTRFLATPFVLLGLFCGAATAVILTADDTWWDWLTGEE